MMAMLKSLETLALKAVPNQTMFQLLRDYYDAPFAQQYLPLFLERCSSEEMEALSRTIPWDHPLARKMDWTVHQRRLKGKTCLFVIPLSKTPTEIFLICWQTNWTSFNNLNLIHLGTRQAFILYD